MVHRGMRSIGVLVAVLFAGLGAHLMASAAVAAPPAKGWTCSAATLQASVLPILGGGLPVGLTAGSDDEQCADRQAGLDVNLGVLNALGIGVGALQGTTTNQPAWGPSEQHPVAATHLTGIDISLLNLASVVKVGAVSSSAEAQCVNGARVATSTYSVTNVKVGGTDIADLTAFTELVAADLLGLKTIVRLTPGEVTDVGGARTIRALRIVVLQRTVFLDTTVVDLTLGQSRVSTAGSPCADPTPPTVGAPTVTGRTIAATVTPPPGGTIDRCSFSVTPTGGSAQTVTGTLAGGSCRADLLPATSYPLGGYTATASARTLQGGNATGPSGAFVLAGPSVGAPELNGLNVAVPVTPGAGATVTQCAMTYAPVGGSAVPLTPATYDLGDRRCYATLPSGLASGDYEIATTVTDSFNDDASGTGVVTLGGPTVGIPAVSGRSVTATVTPAGSPVASCAFVGTRTGGSPVTVPGDFAAGSCSADLPRADFPPGSYVILAQATDDLGRTGSRAGAATIAGPKVGVPTLTKRQLRTPVTPGVEATVTGCAIVVTADLNGVPEALTATYDAGTQSCAAAMPTDLQPGGYSVATTVTDSNDDQDTGQGPVTLVAPTVGVPSIARRVVRAAVVAAPGTSIAGCGFVLTPTPSGAAINVTGTYADGVCSAPLPSPTVPVGDYAIVAQATDDQDVATTNRGTGSVYAAPTVGTPTIDGRDVSAPVTVPAGSSITACTVTVTPNGGGTAIVVPGTFAAGRCGATLPGTTVRPGVYQAEVAVEDDRGNAASNQGPVPLVGPTVGTPALNRRALSVPVAPGPGATVAGCAISIAAVPAGAPRSLTATYDTATRACVATVPSDAQAGGYAVTVTVTDSLGDDGAGGGPVTLRVPTVGTPTLDERDVSAPVTVPSGSTIARCTVTVTPRGGGAPIVVPGTFSDGRCRATLPGTTVRPGDYDAEVTVEDDQGSQASGQGPVTVGGPAVGPPVADGPGVSVPVSPGPGATVTACTLTITPASGGAPITVTGTYRDGVCVATLPADRFPTGDYDVATTVTDSFGDTASKSGRVRITQPVPPRTPEPPKPPEAPKAPEIPKNVTEQAPLICDKRQMTLLDVVRRGRSVRVSGATVARHQGRTVAIRFLGTGKVVARVRVGDDGLFAARVPAPAERYLQGSSSTRYRAEIGKARSVPMRLLRRMSITSVRRSGGRMTFAGAVQRPLSSTYRTVTIRQRLDCAHTRVVARGKVRANGRFSLTFSHREANVAGVYRAETMVPSSARSRKLNRTFTLPRFVPGS